MTVELEWWLLAPPARRCTKCFEIWWRPPKCTLAATALTCPDDCCRSANDKRLVQAAREGLRVAIIAPIFLRNLRDATLVETLLLQLSKQDRPADFIILVDDSSPIPVEDVLSSGVVVPHNISVFRLDDNSGPARARNVGILEAHTKGCDIVCFLDADCAPDPLWLRTMVDAHESIAQKGPSAYGGRTQAAKPFGWVGHYHNFFGTLNGPRMADLPDQPNEDGRLLYAPSCNFSMKLNPDTAPLLFDTEFPAASFEDVEFCCRLRAVNIAIRYLPDAVVYHAYDESVMGLARQFWKYGRWEGLAEEKQPGYLELLRKSWAISCQQP